MDANAALGQDNKALVLDFWKRLDSDQADERASAADLLAADATWHGHAPVGSLDGPASFLHDAWEPLRASFPDLQRETFIFFAGVSNGRVDGDIELDGHHWVTGTGNLRATFAADYLGIPATGTEVALRWGEFCRVVDGVIDEVFFLIDIVDLMQQAGIDVLPPARGADGMYPAPKAADGVLMDRQDPDESAYSLDHIRRFIFDGLNGFDTDELSSMGMADYFAPDVLWYGPGGIGACLSFQEFEDLHQAPWLHAYPDRKVQNLNALFAEGNYSGGPGFAGVLATHTGEYLGVRPTGNTIEFNGLDWWKREGEVYVENWVFVDMIHLFDQFGVDLFARMREQLR